ncbi:MAG: hypothetical protein Pars2KO_31110 [Parasphingorhabdus sp.]
MRGLIQWRYFWIFWGSGMTLFLLLVASGGALQTEVAPGGILDHQAAGSAERVNAIQSSWINAGVLTNAKLGMIGDLTFILLYSVGGIIGGRLLWQQAGSPSLKKFGLLIIVTYFVFFITDYGETISQFVQLMQGQGSNILAGIAAFLQPIKAISWIAGTVMILIALVWFWRDQRA